MSYGEFKVLNPTPFRVVAGFDRLSPNGAEYVFEPFEEKLIYVKDHVDHICMSRQSHGLVQLSYDNEAKKNYDSYEDYKIARSIEGIKAVQGRYSEALMYEQAATAAAKNKDQVVELRTMDTGKFEDKVNELQDLLEVMKAPIKKVAERVKPKTPAWMTGKTVAETPQVEETTEENLQEVVYPVVEAIAGKVVKQFKNGRFMVDGKWAKKADVEALIDVPGNDNEV